MKKGIGKVMSKLVKVYPTSHDPMLNMLYTYDEALDLFGECDEFLVEIPEELQDRFIKARDELYKASKELGELYKKQGSHSV